MKVTRTPIGTWSGMNTVIITPGQNAETAIAKSEKAGELLTLYKNARERFSRSEYEIGIEEYSLVRAEDARKKGVVDSEGRVHRTCKQMHPDCIAIIDYVHGGGCRSPRWTTPVAILVMPKLDDTELTRGFAVTASGTMYILDRPPMTLEDLAKKYPDVMTPPPI